MSYHVLIILGAQARAFVMEEEPSMRVTRIAAVILLRPGGTHIQFLKDRWDLATAAGEVSTNKEVEDWIASATQKGPQNGPGEAAPRFLWPLADEDERGPGPFSAQEAVAQWMGNPDTSHLQMLSLVTSIFLEALTWDQQTRVLARMGWERAT